ncbi:MAG TPA: transglutaminase-like domain-containing protein [Chitinophagaceae bacterium]|nr:transglutaminase-like domain-containing protein [Chitinophagaceae bacterium]
MRVSFKPYLALILLFTCAHCIAQQQTSDDEGGTQAALLKKLAKKAKYGASLIKTDINFSTTKGITGEPVVTALEQGQVEMVSLEDNAYMGYMLPYNQFVKLADYDFYIWYKNGFKSQKYPPEKMSLADDNIFLDDNYGEFYGFKAAEMGQRCKFVYKYVYTDAKYFTRIFFHQGIPIKENTVNINVPSWLDLDIQEENFSSAYHIKKTVHKDKDITTYTYTADNLEAIKQEESSLARPFYLPHLIITVRSYRVNQKKYNGFKTLADMYAWYNFLYKKAGNDVSVLKDQVTTLTQGKTSDEDKIKAIYYWVQDNIRYLAFEEGYSGFVPQSVQTVFKNKYGDCKGMANLVTEMLKLAGYDAHFAWIGTRDIPYSRTQVQSLCVDNHAICVLYLNGKTYFIDGTEKYQALGTNAYRISGKEVLVQNGDGYKVETVPVAPLETNQVTTTAKLTLDDDKITGHVILTFNGNTRSLFHYIYNAIPADKRKDFTRTLVELANKNAEATHIKTSDFSNRDIPITVEGDVEISNQVTLVDNVYYTGIDFFSGTLTGFIPDKDRQTPIDFEETFIDASQVTLALPNGAKVQAMPKPFTGAFKDNSLNASYTVDGNTVVLTKKMQLASPVIYPADFTAWNDFINKVRAFNRSDISIHL